MSNIKARVERLERETTPPDRDLYLIISTFGEGAVSEPEYRLVNEVNGVRCWIAHRRSDEADPEREPQQASTPL